MIEGACAEADRDRAGEHGRRCAPAGTVGADDQERPHHERHRETGLVENTTNKNATWLQVTRVESHGRRPPLAEPGDATLGLHVLDVSIALGNLIRLVRDQAAAFARR